MKIYRPTDVKIINQGFYDNATPIYASLGMKGHGGYDWACRSWTPLFWMGDEDGLVINKFQLPNSGNCLSIFADNKRYGFAHLNKICVKVGDVVKMGDLIGFTGNTGKASTGPHLHTDCFRCKKTSKDTYIDLDKDNGYFGAIPIEYEKEFVLEKVDTQTVIKNLLKTIIYRV